VRAVARLGIPPIYPLQPTRRAESAAASSPCRQRCLRRSIGRSQVAASPEVRSAHRASCVAAPGGESRRWAATAAHGWGPWVGARSRWAPIIRVDPSIRAGEMTETIIRHTPRVPAGEGNRTRGQPRKEKYPQDRSGVKPSWGEHVGGRVLAETLCPGESSAPHDGCC